MRVEKDFAEVGEMRQRRNSDQYLGALLQDERKLVLVPMDPSEPWEAFRRMRTWMRQTNQSKSKASLDVFAAPKPSEHEAKVIPLRRRMA